MDMSWPDLLSIVVSGEDLSREQAAWAMDRVMDGDVSPVQLASLLVALRTKGESTHELAGLAESMVGHAVPLDVDASRAVDIVGTGGDRAFTVNISTMASIVIAGTGLRVVKHGNRASSSASGTTALTRPHSQAVRASITSPESANSRARFRPTVRATATSGVWQKRPPLPPGMAKPADSAATARSQVATSWHPAAVASASEW